MVAPLLQTLRERLPQDVTLSGAFSLLECLGRLPMSLHHKLQIGRLSGRNLRTPGECRKLAVRKPLA